MNKEKKETQINVINGKIKKTDTIEIIEAEKYYPSVFSHFHNASKVIQPLLQRATLLKSNIEKQLPTLPAFVDVVRSILPEETFQAVLSPDQKKQLAKGTIKLMTKKDGSLMANLINPETKKIVSTISLESVKLTPELSDSIKSFSAQMQMAQIAEQMKSVQIAIEEVRQGQENDRLAAAYSCQQKFLQAMAIKNPELKQVALLQIVSDAEDSRNMLMLSQSANVNAIKEQPESVIGKFIRGEKTKKLESRINEVRDSLNAVNMVSIVETMAYQEMGEPEAARQCLEYYSEYVKKTYLSSKGLVERLDLIDPSPINYWSKTLPDIQHKIEALPGQNKEDNLQLTNIFDEGESNN